MWYIISIVIIGLLIWKFISLYDLKVEEVDFEMAIVVTIFGAVLWPVCIALALLYLLYKLLLDKIYTKFITWLLNKYFKK